MGANGPQEIVLEQAGRLDRLLAEALGQSRSQIARLIEAGEVAVEGETVCKPSFRLRGGERIRYRFREAPATERPPVDFDVEILYEDEAILVVNKPAGVVVHPAPSVREATLVDWLRSRGISLSTIAGEERHGIVHRLDKETSGALVIAKSNEAHRILSEDLKARRMGRYYLAIVDHPLKGDTIVERPIGRNPSNRLKMAVVPEGRAARTDFLKLAEGSGSVELIAARLHSGRTHQIRVHLAEIGRHILGDTLYGWRGKEAVRVFLHARLLYLLHPLTREPLRFTAPIPADMEGFLKGRFGSEAEVGDLEARFRERFDRPEGEILRYGTDDIFRETR
ncbi:RluA family pseudouridine synthase [Nitratifractor sp.]